MHALIIAKYKELVITSDGTRLYTQSLLIRGGYSLRKLHYCRNLHKDYIRSIGFVLKEGKRFIRLPFNQKISDCVTNFLHTRHEKSTLDYDCYAFVNSYHGIEQHKVSFVLQHWKISEFSKPAIGEVVLFVTPSSDYERSFRFHHAAIYIGKDFYVSVYGGGGEIEVSTFDDMMRDFKAQKAIIARPKQK